jgi:hypothetical protein
MADSGEERFTVTVAAFGPAYDVGPNYPPTFAGPQLQDQDGSVPYAERLKTEVEVGPSSTLGDAIDQAAASLGISYNDAPNVPVSRAIPVVALFEPGDADGLGEYDGDRWLYTVQILDEDRQPSWFVRWDLVLFDELEASCRAGLTSGDPHRLYMWPVIPQGGPGQEFYWLVTQAWHSWSEVLDVIGTLSLLRLGKRRIQRRRQLRETVQGAMRVIGGNDWLQRLGRPQDLFRFLETPRDTSEVAAFLGCSEPEAVAFLGGIGYVLDQSRGAWRTAESTEPQSALLATVEYLRIHGSTPTSAELERTLRRLERAHSGL